MNADKMMCAFGGYILGVLFGGGFMFAVLESEGSLKYELKQSAIEYNIAHYNSKGQFVIDSIPGGKK